MSIKAKKILNIFMIILLTFNILSIQNFKVIAATTLNQSTLLINRTSDVLTTENGTKYFTVDIAIVGDVGVYSFDFKIGFDSTKINLANKNSTKDDAITLANSLSIYVDEETEEARIERDTVNSVYDVSAKTVRLVATSKNPLYTENEEGYMRLFSLTFKLMDDSLTESELTTDIFRLISVENSLPTGFKLGYDDEDVITFTSDTNQFKFQNFAENI